MKLPPCRAQHSSGFQPDKFYTLSIVHLTLYFPDKFPFIALYPQMVLLICIARPITIVMFPGMQRKKGVAVPFFMQNTQFLLYFTSTIEYNANNLQIFAIMKLHLPLSLRTSLFALFALGSVSVAHAASLHSDATLLTYTDFGQNKGRYVNESRTNALLQYIRSEAGGIVINYTDGTSPYVISPAQGMPNFSATIDEGSAALISPNIVATVCHQLGNIWSYSYGVRELGGGLKQQYDVVNIGTNATFSLRQPEGTTGTYDYMLLRQSRIVTDAEAYALSSLTNSTVNTLTNTKLYHSGGGHKYLYDASTGNTQDLGATYAYITGGINNITSAGTAGNAIAVNSNPDFPNGSGATLENPLPVAPKGGDSGSPLLVYNAQNGRYEYVAAMQTATVGANTSGVTARGNLDWTKETMAGLNAEIRLDGVSEVHLGRVETQLGDTITDGDYSTTRYTGAATDNNGNVLGNYIGLHHTKSTWRSLSDTLSRADGAWYNYNHSNFQNASDADLFFTQNLVFTNPSQEETKIVLDATVDTGIGYTEFGKGELDAARYIIESATTGNYQLHTSGYVIHEDTEVHLRLVNPSDHVSEWRKIGQGDLYIDGEGDTNALLNVGGKGKTYLNQKNGYAAYNVLVNTGATVVLNAENGTSQIERDLTFGAGGGVLDMNGNSMHWYTTAESQADDSRFSINALTEEAVITNDSGTSSVSTLTCKQGGDSTYLGSFVDTEKGALVIDYQGGGTWTLNSIRTDLSHNEASCLSVANGTVRLTGTNTVHAMGSAVGTNTSRYTNANDWHYADAAMKVNVGNGASFELGSHARLTGEVTVEQGGVYIMREGVTHAREYVEGGQELEDTSGYAAFFGHKGDVKLNGGTLDVQFNEGADSTLTYSGTVSGTGTMRVNSGRDGGVFEFSGVIDSTVQKVVEGGFLRLSGAAAADTENKWTVEAGGTLVENADVADTLDLINTDSTGTIALVRDRVEQVESGKHSSLSIGAYIGMTIQYGQAGTSEQLNTWRLGGGGGELVVNYRLSGSHELILGSSIESRGTVTLAGSTEAYTGKLLVQGITVNADLPENEIELNKGCVNVLGELSGKYTGSNITGDGALQLSFSNDMENNELALHEGLKADVHLNKGSVQYNAASSFGGNWTLHDGVSLRLGDKVNAVSDTLKLTVSGKAELQGTGNYSFAAGTLSGEGELVNAIAGDITITDLSNLAHYTHDSKGITTIIQASTAVNDISVKDGHVYLQTDDNNQRAKGNMVIDGGTLHFSSGGTSDMLDFRLSGRSIQVKNGTLDFGTTRQTMGGWSLVLGDAAMVTGNGNATYGAIDFNESNTIRATEGTSEIAAVTRIRSDKTLTYDISKDATLNVTGKVFVQEQNEKANIIKIGDGTLVFSSSGNNYKGTTTIKAGTLRSNNLASLGSVSLAQGSCLELTTYTADTSLDTISGSGKLTLSGSGTVKKSGEKSLAFSVDINSSTTFTFANDDVIDYNADSGTLTVAGGILDFGNTRQTMGNMDIYLRDGAKVTGSGGSYEQNGTQKAALDYDISGSTIYATKGTSTIEAVTRLRSTTTGDVNLNYDVSKDATLTVSGKIHADDADNRGLITKLGEGTLILSAANTYSGTTTVTQGILRIAKGGSIGSSELVLNGGTLEIEGSADNIFSASNKLKVESGKHSVFEAESMTISNALLDVGKGATLELQGGTYTLNGDLGTADSHLVVSSAGLTAADDNRSLYGLVEVKSDVAVTGTYRIDVAKGAELRLLNGASLTRAVADTNKGAYYINGTLTTAENAKGVQFVSVDDIHLNYQMELSINVLQSYRKAEINVGKNATLDASGTNTIKLSSDTSVNLQSGATLALEHLAFSNKADSGTATLKSGGDEAYALSNANYELSNGHMVFDATSQATVKLKLNQSSVENACEHLLTLDNAANTLTGIHATKGDIKVQNVDWLDLEELAIAADTTVTADNVLVSELTRLEAGARLVCNLELANEAIVELDGTAILDGILNLQTGLILTGTALDEVRELAVGESYTLFSGVTELNLQLTESLYNMRSSADTVSYNALMAGEQVAAADYFSNLSGNAGLMLSFDSTDHFVNITHTTIVPEPTTATLSLLALAGLCARRRRR